MEDAKISDDESIKKRPGILIIGSPNVGKRTLLSRLLSADLEDAFDSPSELLVQGWTIDTKYYSADVAVWMAHLHDGFSIAAMPSLSRLTALVMVFDLSELSSLVALKKWVSQTDIDIQRFDILLCIGNKVDLVPGHPVHEEYSRHLRRPTNSSVSSDADFVDYGISETEGSSLLSNDESSCDISRSCLEWCVEWCTEQNIEYVETCASNVDFDKCLSVDGDSQGVDRLLGALSAHMWPGMVLKAGNKVPAPFISERSESSEEDSDYEGDYEILSNGSAEPWDVTEDSWVSAHAPVSHVEGAELSASTSSAEPTENIGERAESSAAAGPGNKEDIVGPALSEEDDPYHDDIVDKGPQLDLEDLDHLMSEITNIRDSSRLMPDFQRREMAAKLAMKMAAMFGDSSGDEKAE